MPQNQTNQTNRSPPPINNQLNGFALKQDELIVGDT